MGNSAASNPVNRYMAREASTSRRRVSSRFDIEAADIKKLTKGRRKRLPEYIDLIDQTIIESGRANLLNEFSSGSSVPTSVDPESDFFVWNQAMSHLRVNWSDPNVKTAFKNVLYPSLKVLTFMPDAIIWKLGDQGTNIYLVEYGVLKMTGPNGIDLGILEAGSIIGDLSLFYGYSRKATMICVEKCKLWSISRKAYLEFQIELSSPIIMKNAGRFLEIPEFSALPSLYVEKMLKQLKTFEYSDGQAIYTTGRGSTKIMVIGSGHGYEVWIRWFQPGTQRGWSRE